MTRCKTVRGVEAILPRSMRGGMNKDPAEGPSHLSKEGLDEFLQKNLQCPTCHGGLTGSTHGYSCEGCAATYRQVGPYIDFLGSVNPLLAMAETKFADEYEIEVTPYWDALCEVTDGFSASLPHRFEKFLTQPARCLDVGLSILAGGRIRPHLLAYHQILSVYCGLEPDSEQLVCSDERLFVGRAIGELLPFRDEVFDLVLIHSVLDHCFDYGRALDEAVRVLATGGLVSVILNNDGSWAKIMFPWETQRRRMLAAGHHHAFFTPKKMEMEMRRRELELVKVDGLRYLILPTAALNGLTFVSGSSASRVIAMIDRLGNRLAPTLGGDFHMLFRKL